MLAIVSGEVVRVGRLIFHIKKIYIKYICIFPNKSLLFIAGLPAVQQGQKTTRVAVFVESNRYIEICRSCEKVLAL